MSRGFWAARRFPATRRRAARGPRRDGPARGGARLAEDLPGPLGAGRRAGGGRSHGEGRRVL